VIGIDVNSERLMQTADALAAGDAFSPRVGDVSSRAEMEAVATDIADRAGRVDVLAKVGFGFILLGGGASFAASGGWADRGIGALAGLIYVLPILLLTLWSAQRLSPAVISFLLTAEILAGVGSAALLLDEPFGLMQAAGAACILTAAAVEVIPTLLRKVPAVPPGA